MRADLELGVGAAANSLAHPCGYWQLSFLIVTLHPGYPKPAARPNYYYCCRQRVVVLAIGLELTRQARNILSPIPSLGELLHELPFLWLACRNTAKRQATGTP